MTWEVVRIAEADGGERFLSLCLYMYWYMYMAYQWNDAPGTLLVCFPVPVPRKKVCTLTRHFHAAWAVGTSEK